MILSQRDTLPRFWAEVTHSAKELGLDEPRQRRQQRLPKRLDWMAAALTNRSGADNSALVTAERALVTAEGEAVAKTAAFYRLDAQRLGLHTQMPRDVARERGMRLKDLEDVASFLRKKNLRKILPAADDLLRIILIAPATSCYCRSCYCRFKSCDLN